MSKAKLHTAYCFTNGVIKITAVPSGSGIRLAFATGSKYRLRKVIWATARLAYDNKTWLVSGVPEAENLDEKREAVTNFANWIAKRPGISVHNDISREEGAHV